MILNKIYSSAAKMKNPINSKLIILAMLAVIFTGIFDRDLWTPDEPREAAISLEMSRSGDFVIPKLAGVPFIEKPPLYYIFTSLSIKALGAYIGNTAAIRLMTALFGVGVLLMTFLLARRLFGYDAGLLAAAMLSIMPGFLETFIWIRSDAALCFFVIAAIWCFAEVYLMKRRWFCIPAGLFTAGAFLSKGLIGPILIAIPWSGLVFLWITDLKKNGYQKTDLFLLPQLFCLFIGLALSGAWIFFLRRNGGETLWHEWFWVNHVGRLLGAEGPEAKGHIRTGAPFYYLKYLSVFVIPWLPLLAAWAWHFFRDILKHKILSKENLFLFVWGAGSLILLSLSATKRPIYLLPVLPVFAIMCAVAGKKISDHPATKGYFMFWIGLCALILGILTIIPIVTPLFSHKISQAAASFAATFSLRNAIAGAGFLSCIFFCFYFKRERMNASIVVISTALLYIGLFVLPVKAIDLEKSMKSDMLTFCAGIPKEDKPHIIAYNFTETIQGNFYYYCDWPVVQTRDIEQLRRILEYKDAVYKSIIVNIDQSNLKAVDIMNKLFNCPYRIIQERYTGGIRGIFWIEGIH